MELMIGAPGNTGNVAAINVTVDAIEGIVGSRSLVEVNEALAAMGHMAEIPVPGYGYVIGRWLLHEKMDFDLRNDWAGGDLDELTYTDRKGGRPLRVIHMPTAMVFV